MAAAIGLLEVKSIPVGVETADAILKSADVRLLLASPACPGKYVLILSGDVGAVKSAMETGVSCAGRYLMAEHLISSIHEAVPQAILGTVDEDTIESLGMIETISALSSIQAGDIAAKSSAVRLLEIRLARGLGGKGFVLFTGDVGAVKAAVEAVKSQMEESGEVTSACVIPSPHPDLMNTIL